VVVTLNGATNVTVSIGGVAEDTIRNIESIIAGLGNDVLNGDGLANTLDGGAGSDTLNGGASADEMYGRGGNDTYFVDNSADVAEEDAGEGSDTVLASVSYTLQAGSEVELLRTLGSATTTPANFTGNELANTLHGNAAANTLNGSGGADTMLATGGNDIYFVDNAFDVVTEFNAQGSDSVIATTSYVLGAGTSVETLRTLGSASNYAVNLVGNELVNLVAGNAAANLLLGKAGSDTLIGYGGADTFHFDTALGAANIDTIMDYNVAADTVQLDDAIFAGLAVGTLAASAFRIGAAAADADDRIIYNSTTGALIFDLNGNAAGGATQFATLTAGLAMANNDIVVI
jgi:Ca2+-binding RTX toxin-like protein